MYQRADEHPEPEHARPAESTEQRELSTADLAAAGNRPIVEPAGEKPANVTPIGTRGERAATTPGMSTPTTPDANRSPLFKSEEAEQFRSDWHRIQAGFVDEPR